MQWDCISSLTLGKSICPNDHQLFCWTQYQLNWDSGGMECLEKGREEMQAWSQRGLREMIRVKRWCQAVMSSRISIFQGKEQQFILLLAFSTSGVLMIFIASGLPWKSVGRWGQKAMYPKTVNELPVKQKQKYKANKIFLKKAHHMANMIMTRTKYSPT